MHSKTHNSLIRFASTLLMVAALSVPLAAVRAQDAGNLLVNGNMEGGFAARDGVSGVPLGWAFFIISGALDADRQAFAPYAFSPPTFWAMRSSFGSWTAGGRQTVAVQQGQNYRLGAHAFIWTCNDPQWSCIPSDAPRFSNTESGARVKIGIDPNGGFDPLSTAIIWSAWIQPWNSYTGITVEAQAISGQMSVFLLAESGSAMAFNEVYWDDITLSPFGGTVAGQVPATAGQSAAV
ncbi:MAG TPA: hypothetical protein VJZ27_07035, partial [Aggregatilineales bacterium]|nr:hypothetical protein [Aggregatilineales bacterium]